MILSALPFVRGTEHECLDNLIEDIRQNYVALKIDGWVEVLEHLNMDIEISIEEIRDKIIDFISDIKNTLHTSREVTWFDIGDLRIFFSGGMSWGDDPTDATRTFWILIDSFPPEILEKHGINMPWGLMDMIERMGLSDKGLKAIREWQTAMKL